MKSSGGAMIVLGDEAHEEQALAGPVGVGLLPDILDLPDERLSQFRKCSAMPKFWRKDSVIQKS